MTIPRQPQSTFSQDYGETLNYIHSLERFGIVPGLERVAALCAALGNPQERLRCVHIAGTNGKGSTSAMLAEILRAPGRRVGLFTSPYVTDFRERMQVDGVMIPEDELVYWAAALRATGLHATEFEFITALAFAWFAAQNCDVVVLEVGLGGRYDATNIITKPLCSVITKIALDHIQILGNTLAKIAAEKCGIIKPGCPVVTTCEQPEEALVVIRATAQQRGCQLILPEADGCEILDVSIEGSRAILAGLPVRVPLPGRHMCKNALTAVTAARALGCSDAAIQTGISRVRMPARMEVLRQQPLVILDGGHNPDGARALAATLQEILPGRRFACVCGMMADKNVAEFLAVLQPCVSKLITCQPENQRALPAEELATMARQAGYANVTAAGGVEDALRLAKDAENLLICGSFYLAGEACAICAETPDIACPEM